MCDHARTGERRETEPHTTHSGASHVVLYSVAMLSNTHRDSPM